MVIYCALLFLFKHAVVQIRVINEAVIMIANTIMLFFLKSKLNCLHCYGLNEAVRSIVKQFAMFVVSYLILLITDIFIWALPNLLS